MRLSEMSWNRLRSWCDQGLTPVDCTPARSLVGDRLTDLLSSCPVRPPAFACSLFLADSEGEIDDWFLATAPRFDEESLHLSSYVPALGRNGRQVGTAIMRLADGVLVDRLLEVEKETEMPSIEQSRVDACLAALALLNVKNIGTADVSAPRHIRRAAKKVGDEAQWSRVRYKMLTLNDPETRQPARSPKGLAYTPFHLVRGHFAHYGEGSKLFGRYTGTFWIPPHSRGRKEFGEVRKGYRPLVPQEAA